MEAIIEESKLLPELAGYPLLITNQKILNNYEMLLLNHFR